jgi:thiol reductant ABC exporter CydD subunit
MDRRLGAAGSRGRRFVLGASVLGLGQSATVVVQAILLASVIRRTLQAGATLSAVLPQVIGLGVAIAARGVLGWASEWTTGRGAAAVGGALRADLVRHMVALGPSWLAGERAGELALSATSGADAVGVYYGRYLPQIVVAALAPVGVLAWVGATDWVSVLILLGLLAAVPPAMVVFGRRALEATNRQWRGLSSLSAHLLELIQGLPTLRAFGRVDYGRREVAEATEGLRRATLRTLRVAFLSSLSLELLAGLGTGLVAMVLGLRLLDGGTTLYVALAVILVSPEVFLPLRRASAEFHSSAEGRSGETRIAAVLAVAPGAPGAATTALPDPHRSTLVLEEVTVEFPDRSTPALSPLSLRVEPGQRVALIGPSGSGKSTALHAVAGLVPLSAGRILLGDVDRLDVDPEAWYRAVSWVPQRPHLFSTTLAENIRLGDPGANDDRLAEAIAAAGLEEVVARLPRGLATAVSERGTTLSTGERHRIAIARAVLHDGPIVVLDEPGSHLDGAARRSLARSLAGWLSNKTVLVAAHHLGVVEDLERVVDLGGLEHTSATVASP